MSLDTHNHLTIILKVRDNHKMTNRWLLNAISQAVKFKILIADGGNVPLEISYEIKNKLQIEHVKTPYDKDHLTYMKKLSFVLNEKVKTKYSLIADDDDFYVFDTVYKFVDFLINNDDYVACCGNILKFELRNILNGNPKFTGMSNHVSFHEQDSIDRFTKILERNFYKEVYYDVIETKIMGKAIEDFIQINNQNVNYRFLEFYTMITALSAGKLKSFKDIYLLRQEDYQSTTSLGLNTIRSIFMENWSLNYFNMLKYTFEEFKIDENDTILRNLITEKFSSLFEEHIADDIINRGQHKISVLALIRSNIKKYSIFKLIKNLKKFSKLYFYNFKQRKLFEKFKKIIISE